LRTAGQIARNVIVAALALAAAAATWIKFDNERTLADQNAPWLIYFMMAIPLALILAMVVAGVVVGVGLLLRRRRQGKLDA
jgi:hypothetical protein